MRPMIYIINRQVHVVSTPSIYLANGMMKGGSMQENNQDNFKEFVRQQFAALNDNLCYLVKSLDFTMQRIAAIEKSMNIKVVTPSEVNAKNLEEMILKA
ncbi:729_t:CDS:2 [Funneliformis geosporum]|uniref:729_t:CDS:1 n=1 Tax=Funneliformis geosporum TaxID=1117311 RepID=A0A9W4SXP9_9GLOM|nr:729_t:CDS:2 [Funneliformis geosporum]